MAKVRCIVVLMLFKVVFKIIELSVYCVTTHNIENVQKKVETIILSLTQMNHVECGM